MTTMREAILASSTLVGDNALRDHLLNLGANTGGGIGGEFICLNTNSFSSSIIETEEGYTLITNNYNTAVIESDTIEQLSIPLVSTECIINTKEITIDTNR